MKNILVFGAGKSATVLIDYLLLHASDCKWRLTIADANLELAKQKIGANTAGKAISFDINNKAERDSTIAKAHVVISMLPPALHHLVAESCLSQDKHLLTASYVDEPMKAIANEIMAKDLLFLCEMGLDPGIDHMSAMRLIDTIHQQGGTITSFKSHCGGLVAPESDHNPWHYKISWNPKNILMAGSAGANYLENGKEKKVSYSELFNETNKVEIEDLEEYGWYPNRDSVSYTSLYQLHNISTFIRTTLRHPAFMKGWKNIVDLEMTDEVNKYDTKGKTRREVLKEHIDKKGFADIYEKMMTTGNFFQQMQHLGFVANSPTVDEASHTIADVLQAAMEEQLALKEEDKDMIVMLHEIQYTLGDESKQVRSSLVVKGDNKLHTAMAKTVGLPLGIATKLLLGNKLLVRGLQIPTNREIYEQVLEELELNGIHFKQKWS